MYIDLQTSYIYIYICCGRKKTNKLPAHLYKPVSWFRGQIYPFLKRCNLKKRNEIHTPLVFSSESVYVYIYTPVHGCIYINIYYSTIVMGGR